MGLGITPSSYSFEVYIGLLLILKSKKALISFSSLYFIFLSTTNQSNTKSDEIIELLRKGRLNIRLTNKGAFKYYVIRLGGWGV